MIRESRPGVYKTQSEKLRYLMGKATNNPEGELYRRMLNQMEMYIRQAGIDGDSGKHYRIGDIVTEGELTGGCSKISVEHLTVFILPTLSEYFRDGLPVEVIIPRSVKTESDS